jgi:hypothetical protein
MPSPADRFHESQFRHSASAHAVLSNIPSLTGQDPLELPPDGGFKHIIWNQFRIPGLLELGSAYAEGQGLYDESARTWRTEVRIAIEQGNVLDVLTFGRISARLVSSYSVDSNQPYFSVLGTVFDDLRIAGSEVQIEFDKVYGEPTRYDQLLNLERFQGDRFLKQADSDRPALASLVSKVNIESESLKNIVRVDGNVIYVPDFGKIRLGEIAIDPEWWMLTLIHLELEGAFTGEIRLGNLRVSSRYDREMREEGPAEGRDMDLSTNLDEEEEAEVRDDLNQWVNTHPRPDEPFLFFMGRSLTPVEFFREVEEKTSFGISFLRFLAEQSKEADERPRDAIRRAVDANGTE